MSMFGYASDLPESAKTVYLVNVCRGHAEGKSAFMLGTRYRCPNCALCSVTNCIEKAEYFIEVIGED